ncbi:MAG: hypothetical protein RBS84_03325 [Kiritimatiellia bacterium]|jgi:ribosomal protein L40E|nr:hypothetical protein [Kiritimatiellia bacterium]
MPESAAKPKAPRRRKVDPALRYRWGVVGLILAIGLFLWYLRTSGVTRQAQTDISRYYEKIICPRCNNEEPLKATCSLCGGKGFIWIDTRVDPGPGREQPVAP